MTASPDPTPTPASTPTPGLTISVAVDTAALPGVTPLAELVQLVLAAERAGATAVTLKDRLVPADPGRASHGLDASIAAAALGPLTHSIGLIAEAPSAVSEPFHVATALQTVDHASLGRAGLALRPGLERDEHDAVGRWPLLDRPAATSNGAVADAAADAAADAIVRDADDTLEAITRLWDSWEEDAVIRDVATGRFLDRERIHDAAFTGERFSIEGASITPRSPQGRPPVVVRVDRPGLIRLAIDRADIVVLPAGDDALREAFATARATPEAEPESGPESESDTGPAPTRHDPARPTPLLWAELPLAQATPARLTTLAGLGFAGVQLVPTAPEHRPETVHGAVAALTGARADAAPGASRAASGTLRHALGLAPAQNPHTLARRAAAHPTTAHAQEDSLV